MQHRLHVFITLSSLALAAVSGASSADAQAPGQLAGPAAGPDPIIIPSTEYNVVNKKYGWQIILADAAILTASSAVEKPELLFGVAISGSTVHALHGNWGRAGISLGLRLGLPVIGGIAGALMLDRSCQGAGCHGFGALLGIGSGFVTALVLDYTVVAREQTFTVKERSWARLVKPTAAVRDGGVRLGLQGSF